MNIRIHNRETIAPRAATWHQIEVAGEHPARLGSRSLTQVIDAEAIQAIAADIAAARNDPHFDGILVDADHLSHDAAQPTAAMAWLMNAEVREGQLWGLVEWSDLGAQAVNGGRYKYFSTEYDAGDLSDLGGGRVRPSRLAGLALTNRPNNKGGRPITNRNGQSPEQNPTPKQKTMTNIAEKLGLPAEATEEQIVAEIGAIQNRAAEADRIKAEAEVEEILNRHASRIPEGQRDTWREAIVANRDAEKLLLTLPEAKAEDKPGPRPAITNRETAGVPDPSRALGGDDAAGEADAAAIRNRAHEIAARERVPFSIAFARAQGEQR